MLAREGNHRFYLLLHHQHFPAAEMDGGRMTADERRGPDQDERLFRQLPRPLL